MQPHSPNHPVLIQKVCIQRWTRETITAVLIRRVAQRDDVEVPAEAEPLALETAAETALPGRCASLEATPAVETRPADTDGSATEPTSVHGLPQPSAKPASEGKQSDSPAPAAVLQR